MTDLIVSRREIDFLMHDWLDISGLLVRAGVTDHDRETIDGFIKLSERLAVDAFLPFYKEADQCEPWQDTDGLVHILPSLAHAVHQHAELGILAAGFAPELGGVAMPFLASSATLAMFMSANISAASFTMISAANARLICTFGSPAQIDMFARPQIEGRWWGTMCLSEPQAGSSLGDIRTRAEHEGEDEFGQRYRITGHKMWISAADHDGAENIVHLVLAKVPQPDRSLPEGTQGISLFIVPKILPDGLRNDTVVAGLNHKMGYRGIPNTIFNLGEQTGAVGWMVGAPGQGLKQMFMMMNEARIGVGIGAAALAWRGYRHAVAYARERKQGRPAGQRGGDSVPIIQHADVKRMLLAQKALAEGALALCFYCAKLVDERDDADSAALLNLLTPVTKTWPAENGLVANDLAIQTHGGYGYTRDFDVEQIYRDNRLNPIHEGTTGIQAIDLLDRKLLRDNGRSLAVLLARVKTTAARASLDAGLCCHAATLLATWDELEELITTFGTNKARSLAYATPFIQSFGHAIVAWLWLDIALCVSAGTNLAFAEAKLRACRYFFEVEVPRIGAWLSPVITGSDVVVGAPDTTFD